MLVSEMHQGFEISTDMITVWVNNEQGRLVGRFGPTGMEAGGNGIGWWVQPTESPYAWIRWTTQLGVYHKVIVPKKFRPVWNEPKVPPDNDNNKPR